MTHLDENSRAQPDHLTSLISDQFTDAMAPFRSSSWIKSEQRRDFFSVCLSLLIQPNCQTQHGLKLSYQVIQTEDKLFGIMHADEKCEIRPGTIRAEQTKPGQRSFHIFFFKLFAQRLRDSQWTAFYKISDIQLVHTAHRKSRKLNQHPCKESLTHQNESLLSNELLLHTKLSSTLIIAKPPTVRISQPLSSTPLRAHGQPKRKKETFQ